LARWLAKVIRFCGRMKGMGLGRGDWLRLRLRLRLRSGAVYSGGESAYGLSAVKGQDRLIARKGRGEVDKLRAGKRPGLLRSGCRS